MSQLFQDFSQPFQGTSQPFSGLVKKSAFWEAGILVGVLSVFSRSSVGKIRQGIREEKRMAILTNSTF